MLNLENALKETCARIIKDKNECDKIWIHLSNFAGTAIKQHAQEIEKIKREGKINGKQGD